MKNVRSEDVRNANRRFYDLLADRYEAVDGRRSEDLSDYVRSILRHLRRDAPDGPLLDLGAGSGFVSKCAAGIFQTRIGTDISPGILATYRDRFDMAVASSVDQASFAPDSFAAVAAFAVLHHLYDVTAVAREAFRILKPGGMFYADHDMSAAFFRVWKPLLLFYRLLRFSPGKYRRSDSRLTYALYRLSEWGERGIDDDVLNAAFAREGFTVTMTYHWYGLNSITDRLFGKTVHTRRYAPLIRLIARKPEY